MWKCEAFSYSTMLKPETKERGDDDAREMVHKAWLWTTGPNYRPDCELLLQIIKCFGILDTLFSLYI